MKKTIAILVFSLGLLNVRGQTNPNITKGDGVERYTIPDSSFAKLTLGSGTFKYAGFMINGDTVNRTILRFDANGDMWYCPKYFSQCDTSAEMRFLYNIHTGSFKKEEQKGKVNK